MILFNKDLSLIYDCRECKYDEKRKEFLGCEKDSENMVWETDCCYYCHGIDNNCEHCDGSNKISVFRCPRAMAIEVMHIIPYFTDWRISNRVVWPNGQSRLYQPHRLTEAFDLLDSFVQEAIEDESESKRSTPGNKQGY